MNESKKVLYIPIKTLDSDDFIEGIGKVEVAFIGVGIMIALLLGIVVADMAGNSLAGIGAGIVISILSIGIFRRDSTNENLIRKLRIIYQFSTVQKRYLYQHFNVLESMDITEVSLINMEEHEFYG